VAHEPEDPELPIKPGYSTAGLATIRPRGEFAWEARVWIATADRPGWRPRSAQDEERKRYNVTRTDPPAVFEAEPNVAYRVRHQVIFEEDRNRARFRIWREGEPEPKEWLCEEDDGANGPDAPRHDRASFGLFMHSGIPSEWWDIRLGSL
jgi:hypothetical protein